VEDSAGDPLMLKAAGDLAVDRAVQQLKRLLHEAAARLRPFPSFPGAFFTNAIEVEAPGGGAGRGCVVVCEDGELYELRMGVDLESLTLGFSDPVSLRSEQLERLDLYPTEYIAYAFGALTVLVERLLEQEGEKGDD
jgi:hypothetical protein